MEAKVGSKVLYKQRDGTQVPAEVIAIRRHGVDLQIGSKVVQDIVQGDGSEMWSWGERLTKDHLEAKEEAEKKPKKK